MRSFFKGLLLIVCLLVILGAILDRNDPPMAPLLAMGAVSTVILALSLLLRRFARRFRHVPASLAMGIGLILFVWGAAQSGNGSGWDALGAIIVALLGVLLLVSAGIGFLVAWLTGRPAPRE